MHRGGRRSSSLGLAPLPSSSSSSSSSSSAAAAAKQESKDAAAGGGGGDEGDDSDFADFSAAAVAAERNRAAIAQAMQFPIGSYDAFSFIEAALTQNSRCSLPVAVFGADCKLMQVIGALVCF